MKNGYRKAYVKSAGKKKKKKKAGEGESSALSAAKAKAGERRGEMKMWRRHQQRSVRRKSREMKAKSAAWHR
jgi:hypothetical protein